MNLFTAVLLGAALFGAGAFCALALWLKGWRLMQDEAERRRQTQSTEAGILDTMCDITNIDMNLSEIRARLDTVEVELGAARKRLGIVRRDPYGYPRDGRFEEQGDE